MNKSIRLDDPVALSGSGVIIAELRHNAGAEIMLNEELLLEFIEIPELELTPELEKALDNLPEAEA